MKRLSFFDKFIYFINSLLSTLLLLSYALPYISPKNTPILAILSLFVPVLLIINIAFFLYWLTKLKKQLLLSGLILLIGWFVLTPFYKLSKKNTSLNSDLKVMSYNVRMFNRLEWIKENDVKKNIFSLIKENDPDNFEDVVRNSFFSYYFELEPIFRDHASISPVMTNKDLSNESSDEESDSDDSSIESVFMTPKAKDIGKGVSSSKRGKDEDVNENKKKIKSSEKEKESNKGSAKKMTKNVKKGIPSNNETKMDEYLTSKKKQCDNECENKSIVNKIEIIKQVKDLHENQGFSENKIRRWFPELKDVVDIYFADE